MKKRIFTMMVAFMAMLTGMSVSAKSYNIWVAGVQVTDENKGGIKSDAITRGKVWYDSQTNELWVDDLKMNVTQDVGIKIGMDLTVRTKKLATINGGKFVPVMISKGTNVTFLNSRLYLETTGVPGLYLDGGKMKAVNTYISSIGKWGLAGDRGEVETVDLDWSCLNLNGTEAACSDLLSLKLSDCSLPDGVTYDSQEKALVRAGSPVKEAVIEETSKLKVCNYPVGLRHNNLGSPEWGGYWYDNTTGILQLRDLNWVASGGTCVWSAIPGLKIKTKGKCTVNCNIGFNLEASTILEDVNMDLTVDLLGIHLRNAPVGIYDSEITVNSKKWALAGENRSSEKVEIHNCDLKLNGTTAAVADVTGFKIQGCEITSPAGAAYNAESGDVELNGKTVTNLEIASPVYDLTIGDIQFKGSNCSNFKIPGLENGEIIYYPSYNLLTLKDVFLKTDYGIKNKIQDLTIQCLGDVYIETANSSAIISVKNFIITGPGVNSARLIIKAPIASGIYTTSNLLIEHMTLDISGRWGIAGYDGSSEELTIDGCNVTAAGTDGSICDFKSLTLSNCGITAPVNAAFDAVLHGVAVNGALVTETVKIEKGAGVEGVIADEVEDLNAPMFNIMGQQIKQPYNGQIYIQNGKKKVWRE